MSSRHTHPGHLGRQRQSGLATLLITVVILVAITLMVIFAAQTAILDQRMSANELRMKHAASAAQAGVEFATAQLNSGQGLPSEQLHRTFDGDNQSNAVFRVAFLDPNDEVESCPATPDDGTFPGDSAPNTSEVVIFSCGWSDDASARKGISVSMRASPSMADPPTNPLTSLSGVNTNGAARVFNYFNNLTIWTAAAVDVTGNPGTTYVRNQSEPPPSDLRLVTEDMGQSQINRYYSQTTDRQAIGPDVIDADLSLRQLEDRGGDAYFENFMGAAREDYKAQSLEMEAGADLDGLRGQAVWVDGDTSIEGNTQIGTRDEPVVLVVDGDLDVAGNVDLYGVLYVRGDLGGSGTFTNYGAAIVEGETNIGGNPYFIFDPDIAYGASNVGARGIVTGTWRDWVHEQ
ncbi:MULTISPECIES: PilX N-terminal domain-containing pilus assembly protein [unclassified Thioalkalivibrio]|uniref:pilus assembly PilX family protein n=1 Tax=unclassified Thioalkalivibrio TaxID=2621013 RepID=UPI001E29D437|nr:MULTISPECIES: PilX N-terminal domain-containing pilus assembly protein [unclassified Thioalkalivibrio]